jgi:hypothetical protein
MNFFRYGKVPGTCRVETGSRFAEIRDLISQVKASRTLSIYKTD